MINYEDLNRAWRELVASTENRPRLHKALKAAELYIEKGGGILFSVRNQAQKDWIKDNLLDIIKRTLGNSLGDEQIDLDVITDEEMSLLRDIQGNKDVKTPGEQKEARLSWEAILGGIIEVVLGEPFPMKQYVQPGDFTRAFFTASSFNVIISLTNLTKKEESLIADKEFDIFIVDTDYGPFIVFRFGKELSFDFSLNIQKMNQSSVSIWLNSPDQAVTLYLLEGSDSSVKAIRLVHFEKMREIKESCVHQLNKTKEEIDFIIQMVNTRTSITDLIEEAQFHFVVPKVRYSL